jgi:hypothetical protein
MRRRLPHSGVRRRKYVLYGNVLRMSLPLNIAKSDVDEAMLLDESFAAVR